MTRQQAVEAVQKFGSLRKAAVGMRVSRKTIRALLDVVPAPRRGLAAVAAEQGQKRKTLADFKASYDKATIVPTRIKDALRELGAGGWEYEVQFARMANVSLSDLGNFRSLFDANVVAIDRGSRRVWAGSAKLAQQMREMI